MLVRYARFGMVMSCLVVAMWAGGAAQAQDYLISVKVHVGNELVPVQHLSGLSVSGVCFLGNVFMADAEGVPNGVLHILCCATDTLVFQIVPAIYGRGVSLDCWEIDGHPVGDGLGYIHEVAMSKTIHVRLIPGPPLTIDLDPVSWRWRMAAGQRSGGSLLWGPAYQTARRAVCDPRDEEYPALLYSGEAFEKQVDLAVAGRGLDFVWGRVHRSGAQGSDTLGGEWTHSFDIVVDALPDLAPMYADVRLGNGTTKRFLYRHNDATVRYFYAPGWDAELRLDTTPKAFTMQYSLVFGDGVTWWFEMFDWQLGVPTLRLERIEDRFGNTMTFAYDASDRLETITDTLNRAYTISYDTNGLITSLVEEDGLERTISYSYDSDDLDTVTYPDDVTLRYDYDSSGRLTAIVDGRGNLALTNTYSNDLLNSQTLGVAPDASVVGFEYVGMALEPGEYRGVRVTDGAGHITEHYFNDANQQVRLCEVDTDATHTTRSEWDSHVLAGLTVSDNLPTRITLPDGMVFRYEYAGPGAGSAYARRMNPTRIEQMANDASSKKLVVTLTHNEGLPFWDARFGESFAVRQEVRDQNDVLIHGTTYTRSTNGLATLDGIDHDGLPAYPAPHHHDEFRYNAYGQLIEHTLPENPIPGKEHHRRRDTFSFPNGYLTEQVTDADGLALKTTFERDAVGRIRQATRPEGHQGGSPEETRTALYLWTLRDQLCRVSLPGEDVGPGTRPLQTFGYDENGNTVGSARRWCDPDGLHHSFGSIIDDPEDGGNPVVTTRYDYDSRNRVVRVRRETDAAKNVTRYHYDANGNITQIDTPLAVEGIEPDNIVEIEYDARDLPRHITRSRELLTRLDYDGAGRLTRRVEGFGTPEARGWEYAHDGLGHVEYVTDPAGVRTRIIRNVAGQVLSVVTPATGSPLARTDYQYDLRGRLTTVNTLHRDAEGRDVGDGWSRYAMAYSDAGLVLSQALEGGATRYTYDTALRLVSIIAPTGDILANEYDRDGNITSVQETSVDTASHDTMSFRTEFDYDLVGQVVVERIVGGASPRETVYAYDTLGRLVRETNALGRYKAYDYDPLGRLTRVTYDRLSVNDPWDDCQYDSNSRLVLRDGIAGRQTRFAYDTLDRLTATTYHDGTVERVTQYDAVGNVLEYVSQAGLITNTRYDAWGRPLEQRFAHLGGRSDPGTTSFAYDPLGRLVSAANEAAAVERQYDSLGNLNVETVYPAEGESLRSRYTYDNKGRRTQFAPPGLVMPFSCAYDVGGRMTQIKRAGATIASFDYLGGRITGRHYGNGIDSEITFDPSGRRVESIVHTDGSKAVLDSRTYTWDAVYNLIQFEITGGPLAAPARTYMYDFQNRLEGSSIGESWYVTDAGNRHHGGYEMTGDDLYMNRYTEAPGGGTRHYDSAGALNSVGQAEWYGYDAAQRLAEYQTTTATLTTSISIEPSLCRTLSGLWAMSSAQALYETGPEGGAILRDLPEPAATLSVQYRHFHWLHDLDGDGDTNEAAGDDYAPKFFAQLLLAVDPSHAVDAPPYHPYLALRIAPDQLALVEYDGTEVRELDATAAVSDRSTWYTVRTSFEGGRVTIHRLSTIPGETMARLQGESTVLAGLGGTTAIAGFTVGGASDFRFRNLEHSGETNAVGVSVTMAYDPLGRKIGVTYRLGGDTYAQTYAYDGWRLVQERHANSGDAIAEYIHGPRYVDDVVASLRDTDGDGAFNPTSEVFYHLTDHQYSTLALTDPAGTAVERIGYTPFGWPAFYDGAGLETEGPTTGNPVLYTGRFADYALRLYDYRTRYYDPAHGRFTTPDPLGPWGDPANLGNPYTYLGNNPASGVDPYGLWGVQFGENGYNLGAGDPTIILGYDALAGSGQGLKGFFWTGPSDLVTGLYSIVRHPVRSVQGVAGLAEATWNDPGAVASEAWNSIRMIPRDPERIGALGFDVALTVATAGAGRVSSLKYADELGAVQRTIHEGLKTGAGTRKPAGTLPRWRQYEMKYGSEQTTLRTTFKGDHVTVRLDRPPSGSQIIDFKDYNWANPTYGKQFIQERVMNDLQTQIRKYKTIRPNVHLQFSQDPPDWVVKAISDAGGTFDVVP